MGQQKANTSNKAPFAVTSGLVPRGKHLWTFEGELRWLGAQVPSRMTIAGWPRGLGSSHLHLLLVSPFPMLPEILSTIKALGEVRFILAPNTSHNLWAGDAKAAFPAATLIGPESLAKKRRDLQFDCLLPPEEPCTPPALWPSEYLALKPLTGLTMLDEIMVLHRPSKTLILTDAAFNFDVHGETPVPKSMLVSSYLRMAGGYRRCCCTSPFKLFFTDPRAAERALGSVLEGWEFEQVVIAHGSVISTGGKQALREGTYAFASELAAKQQAREASRSPEVFTTGVGRLVGSLRGVAVPRSATAVAAAAALVVGAVAVVAVRWRAASVVE